LRLQVISPRKTLNYLSGLFYVGRCVCTCERVFCYPAEWMKRKRIDGTERLFGRLLRLLTDGGSENWSEGYILFLGWLVGVGISTRSSGPVSPPSTRTTDWTLSSRTHPCGSTATWGATHTRLGSSSKAFSWRTRKTKGLASYL